jgi:hypothetical protein
MALTQDDVGFRGGIFEHSRVVQGALDDCHLWVCLLHLVCFPLVADQQAELPLRVGLVQGEEAIAADVARGPSTESSQSVFR